MNEQEFTPYAWEELKQRWEREEMTVEQLSGQLLVWLRQLYEMLAAYQREQEIMTHTLARYEHEQEGMGHALADLEARLQGLAEQVHK